MSENVPPGVRTRVVHLVPALFDRDDGIVGGAERYAFELARHMATAVPTTLMTFGSRAREERVGQLRVRVVRPAWLVQGQRSNPFAFRIFGEIRQADVVHCHQQHIVASSAAALAARVLGRRAFCTDLGGGGLDVSAFVSTDRLFKAHLHISQFSRRVFGHEGQPWAHVIHGGVDTVRFTPSDTVGREGAVVFVGRILPHKGVDAIIKGLPPNIPLRIVGPAADQAYLADLRRLAVGKPVTFVHDASDADLVEEYQRAMCVVLPSVHDDMYGRHTDVPELLGQTLLEGMACGTPGICTNVASLPEIVQDGQTGFIVPPNAPDALGDAITRLASNPELSRRLGTNAARDINARFNWRGVVSECLRLYEAHAA